MKKPAPRCTCYVENPGRKDVTATVDCEKHSTPELRALREAAKDAKER